ncbi:hypothetical protein Z043_116925 [Scleropages formosus]|uniref:Uncharacterized protein n=1 Tax=Scleropages formosus TaxID=113540 RepID=A0A0P7TTP2_SCLFO|nr:hypothetical protein Z043_116925 [Scleropages formosus]
MLDLIITYGTDIHHVNVIPLDDTIRNHYLLTFDLHLLVPSDNRKTKIRPALVELFQLFLSLHRQVQKSQWSYLTTPYMTSMFPSSPTTQITEYRAVTEMAIMMPVALLAVLCSV